MNPRCRQRQSGFTLVELIIVLAVLVVVSLFAAMNNGSPGAYTLLSQTESMASDLRHVQTLAATWGKRLRITTTSTGYSVSCVTLSTWPCDATPVVNPATGESFTVALQNAATLIGPSTPLDIDSLGKPSAAATYTLSVESSSRTVAVQALTGFVSLP